MNKLVFSIGTVVYILLAILSLMFYVERTAFVDISFHLFHIIKDGYFAIQNNRFGAFFTQLFPLIGSKIGLDLDTIMKLYSVGFVLYYYAIFFVCVRILKSYQFGLVMLLLSTLMVTDTFYWIQSELPQGLALLVLYYALIDYSEKVDDRYKWILRAMIPLIVLMLVFFHPLLMFPFLFIAVFLYLKYPRLRSLLQSGTALFIFILIIKSLFFKTGYDSSAMGGVKNFLTLFPDYIFLKSNKRFVIDAFTDYYMMIIALIGLVIYYVKSKEYAKLFLVCSFFLGYTLLVNVSYPNGADKFYIENLYLPLSLFVAVALVFDIVPHIQSKKYFIPILCTILLVRIIHIGLNHTVYTQRVDYLNKLLSETALLDQRKMIISSDRVAKDTVMMTWGTPYESWLLSTINTGETRSILVTDNIGAHRWKKEHNKKFATTWGVFDYDKLPKRYFILPDTTYYDIKE